MQKWKNEPNLNQKGGILLLQDSSLAEATGLTCLYVFHTVWAPVVRVENNQGCVCVFVCVSLCVCVSVKGGRAFKKIENWKLCCNLEPYQLLIHVLISKAQHTRAHTHTHTHTHAQLKACNMAPLSHPLLPKSLNCHLLHTQTHTQLRIQSAEKDSLVTVFGFVISAASVAGCQVIGAEFRKLGFHMSRHERARAFTHTWSLASLAIGGRAVTVKGRDIRYDWAEKIITALSALTGSRASWLPYKQFTCLIDWHKMAAGRWLNSGLSWGQILCGCNKHNSADKIDPSNDFLYNKWVFIIFTTLKLPSGGTLEIQSRTYYQCLSLGCTLRALGLLHDCSLFMIYLIKVSLTVAPLGLWFSLICAIKNSPMHYVEPVWCVNDV